jgi:sugar phosphate isomerase/epimerase
MEDLFMRLGIIRYWNEASFVYAEAKKLEFLEFDVNHDYPADNFAAQTDNINNWIKRYGVPVQAIGRWGETRINPDGSVNENGHKSDLTLIESAAKIGCPFYMCGVNYTESKSYDENIETAVNYLSELVKFGKEKGVKIAVYNCDWSNFIVNPKAWEKILPRVEGLGIKFDPSHSMGRNADYFAELRDFAKYICHFHVKGVVKIEGREYDNAPAGLDMIPWGAVMDMLYANRYTGGLSIEPHSSKWRGRRGEWGIDFTINYMRQFLMPNELDGLWD